MKEKVITIKLKDLLAGTVSEDFNGKRQLFGSVNGEEHYGIFAYNGKLEVRPQYQREYVWKEEQASGFIDSILNGWSINPIYIARISDEKWELVDGQQRVLTACRYYYERLKDGDGHYHSQSNFTDLFDNFEFKVFLIDYENDDEKLKHFRAINKPITILTEQELRNSAYNGQFVNALKEKFGRKGCEVDHGKEWYNKIINFKEDTISRQLLTETALLWHLTLTNDIVYEMVKNNKNHSTSAYEVSAEIEAYMNAHKDDKTCRDVWDSFSCVAKWEDTIFGDYVSREMTNVKNWAYLYRTYRDVQFSAEQIEKIREELADLMDDCEIHHKYSIPEYLLIKYSTNMSGEESQTLAHRLLSLASFDDKTKREVYRAQNHICPDCGNEFELSKLEAHHIVPWSKGGVTERSNCVLLCAKCHGNRHNYGKG